MSVADWVLIALVAGYCGWLLFRPKKKSHCGGCKGNCDCCNCHKNVV